MSITKERTPKQYEELGRLTQGLLHNTNNSLASIIGFAEFLTEDLPKNTQPCLFAQNIKKSGEHLKDMIKQMWLISGMSELSHTNTDTTDLEEAIETILLQISEATLKNFNIKLEFDIQNDIGNTEIQAHQGYLSIALIHLLNNAIESFDPDNNTDDNDTQDKTISVTLKIKKDNPQKVVLTIFDTGSGMPQDVLKQCQKPFFSTKDPSEHHGLGLTISETILKTMNAAVTMNSKPGKGTLVTIDFPLHPLGVNIKYSNRET
jgi:two-component system cell cycle sensor histidine kinase/response regulator CckA